MPLAKLDFPPGIFRPGTQYEAQGRWYDGNLIRWVQGVMQSVGGWQKLTDTAGDILLTDVTYLSLPGESGDYASTPNAAALDITGDLDLRAAVALDDWTSVHSMLFDKKGSSAGFRFWVQPDGKLKLEWHDGATLQDHASTTAVPATDGELLLVRTTLDVDNGASAYEVKFYTKSSTPATASADLVDNADWAQLGTTITGAATTSIAVNTADLELGADVGGTQNLWPGKYYAAAVLDGIDGTVAFDADFTEQLVGATSFTEDSSNAATVTINQSGDPQAEIVKETDTAAGIPAMGMFGWRDNDDDAWLVMGTPERAYVYSQGSTTEITPASFTGGAQYASTVSGAYGDGKYGVGVYGEGGATAETITEAQSWQFDNFGEYLVAVAHSDGQLLNWQLNTSNDLAVTTNAPTSNLGVVVTPERFLVALGAGGDPRKVQWADQESLTTWAAASSNQAGDFILPGQGGCMTGRRGRGETLIWTGQDLFSMKYIGGTLVYTFDQVGSNCGLIGRRAVAMADGGRAFWMGHRSFFTYNGYAQPIGSDVNDYVFSDLNRLQASKFHAVHRAEYNEVWWFYCSAGSSDIDRYALLNYAEGHWSIGQLNRSAGVDRGPLRYPLMADKNGSVYQHDRGTDQNDVDGNAMTPYAESGPMEIGSGDRYVHATSLIPDERTLGDVQAKLFTAAYPTASETEHGPFSLANPTDVRVSGRQVRLRVEQVSPDWRVGIPRLEIVPGEER